MNSKYRGSIASILADKENICITDGGIETSLIFHQNCDLPCFAACDLLKTPDGTQKLYKAFEVYAELAQSYEMNLLLESATWRASKDWLIKQLNYTHEEYVQANIQSIELLERLRDQYEGPSTKIFISGCVGPRGDGYVVGEKMNAEEAEDYHMDQISILARQTRCDSIGAMTMTYAEEAIGIVRAARKHNIPSVISFTLETDGRLPSGQSLREAIEKVDKATDSGPLYYMINCAHTTHFQQTLKDSVDEQWMRRLQGLRANASSKSHAELEACTELDEGNPEEHGKLCLALQDQLSHVNILGGCCGTDHRHIEEICKRATMKAAA